MCQSELLDGLSQKSKSDDDRFLLVCSSMIRHVLTRTSIWVVGKKFLVSIPIRPIFHAFYYKFLACHYSTSATRYLPEQPSSCILLSNFVHTWTALKGLRFDLALRLVEDHTEAVIDIVREASEHQ